MKKSTIKTPPRGGDAAAAWDHNLKPGEKEALAEAYKNEQARKLMFGRNVVLLIVIVNAVLAIASIFVDFDAILLGTRVLMCIALFMGAPGVKFLFTTGALVSVIIISGSWISPDDSETFKIVYAVIESACLVVSSLILFVDENVSEYLYMKRNG